MIKQSRKLSKGPTQVLCEDRLAIRTYGSSLTARKKSNFDEESVKEPKTGNAQGVGSLSGKVDHYVCAPRKNPSQGKAHWLKSNLLSKPKVEVASVQETMSATGKLIQYSIVTRAINSFCW